MSDEGLLIGGGQWGMDTSIREFVVERSLSDRYGIRGYEAGKVGSTSLMGWSMVGHRDQARPTRGLCPESRR